MKRLPAFLILTIITLVAAVLLALTDDVTRGPIAAASLGEADAARKAVLASAESFTQLEAPQGVDSLYEGLAGGQGVGHVATVTVPGFAGPVEITLGVDSNHAITGLSVGGSAFAETAGLGDKARQPEFTDQFLGKALPVTLNGDVDAISGATITSRAVVDGVNTVAGALGIEGSAPAPEATQEPAVAEDAAADPRLLAYPGAEAFVNGNASYDVQIGGQTVGKVAMVTIDGFAGPMEVTVGLDAGNTLTGVSVGGAGFAETQGLGSKAQEPAFTGQFVGKTPPVKLGEGIDAISGATITSTAVVEAVNTVGRMIAGEAPEAQASQEPAQSAAEPAGAPEPAPAAVDPVLAAVYPAADAFVGLSAPEGMNALYEAQAGGSPVGHVAVVTKQGRNGPVEVTLGLDLDQKLTGISVGGKAFVETPDLGGKAQDPAFTGQFVGKSVPLVLGQDVDAVSGATITSTAVVDAINLAAGLLGQAAAGEPSPLKAVYPAAEDFVSLPAPEGMVALYEAQAGGSAIGHVAVVSEQGFAGPVEVTVGMDLAGVLTGISVGGEGFAETKGFGAKAQEPAFTGQFAGKSVPVALGDNIDVISGATITSSAVQNAVNLAAKAMGASIEFTVVDTQSSATN